MSSAIEVLKQEYDELVHYTDESTGKGIDHDYQVKMRDAIKEALFALEQKDSEIKLGFTGGYGDKFLWTGLDGLIRFYSYLRLMRFNRMF